MTSRRHRSNVIGPRAWPVTDLAAGMARTIDHFRGLLRPAARDA